MKLYVWYASPQDDMAFDAIRGMVLVHGFVNIKFCQTPEESDLALLLVSASSSMEELLKTQKKLLNLMKPFKIFHIHGKSEDMPNIEALPVLPWDEAAIIFFLDSSISMVDSGR